MVLYSPNTSIANTSTVVDLDMQEDNDMTGLGPYARDIFTYLKESEVSVCVCVCVCVTHKQCPL